MQEKGSSRHLHSRRACLLAYDRASETDSVLQCDRLVSDGSDRAALYCPTHVQFHIHAWLPQFWGRVAAGLVIDNYCNVALRQLVDQYELVLAP